MAKKQTHAVVFWFRKGEEDLANELLEAIALKKLILKGEGDVGSEVSLQYKNSLWQGTILSLHGKCDYSFYDLPN